MGLVFTGNIMIHAVQIVHIFGDALGPQLRYDYGLFSASDFSTLEGTGWVCMHFEGKDLLCHE